MCIRDRPRGTSANDHRSRGSLLRARHAEGERWEVSVTIECSSIVTGVVVHARGALVTREVVLPSTLPLDGVLDIAVPGITRLLQPGSARARLEGSERVVSAVQSTRVVPAGEYRPGPTLARVRELSARAARLGDEHRVLSERRTRLIEITLAPEVRALDERKRERDAFDVRFAEALQVNALLNEKLGKLDEQILALEQEKLDVRRALDAAQLEDRQASSQGRAGIDRPTRTITARLVGTGPVGRLFVTYAVAAARWWPTYTLRVEGGATRATWTFEALVAQRSGEDWSGVNVALSSADLVFDARLPELASLRFGRAQIEKRRAFRPPPAGVEEMFAAYLAFGGGVFAPRAAKPLPPPPAQRPSAHAAMHSIADDDEDTAVNALEFAGSPHELAAAPPMLRQPMPRPQSASMPMKPPAKSFGAPMGAPMAPPCLLYTSERRSPATFQNVTRSRPFCFEA